MPKKLKIVKCLKSRYEYAIQCINSKIFSYILLHEKNIIPPLPHMGEREGEKLFENIYDCDIFSIIITFFKNSYIAHAIICINITVI